MSMKKVTYAATVLLLMVGLCASAQNKSNKLKNKKSKKMEISNKQKAVAVIRSLETGEKEPVNFINPNKYIQHNLGAGDGLAGFGAPDLSPSILVRLQTFDYQYFFNFL
jgi:hypothetical protein